MVLFEQATLQFAALPVIESLVQLLPSSQLVGQVPGGSQVSPGSTTELPQLDEQSPSLTASHPAGQQPSPPAQLTMETFEQATLQFAALPVMVSTVQLFPSSQLTGQLPGGSQVSPASTTELPQLALQSSSVVWSQPAGQHPSPSAQLTMDELVHATLQLAALPVMESTVQLFPSSQLTGQVPGGSQVSPGSTTELPQLAEQSPSLTASQPAGQQPSPPAQLTMATLEHAALQVAALPVMVSFVQSLPSSQLTGQVPGGSQVSPDSTTELPQLALQSPSVVWLQPAGQQLSPAAQLTMGAFVQATLQLAALPVMESLVQLFPSSQLTGQVPGGSQVSPGSTTELPQLALQSLSDRASQPAGQQLSPLVQLTMGTALHATLQFAALPVMESIVQAFPSSQPAGQLAGGSQVSPGSTKPSPHVPLQSLSDTPSHPAGQQPSLSAHRTMGRLEHATLQLAALPVRMSSVHALPSSQLVGQLDGGSQVSSLPMLPLPQLGEQSLSLVRLQPAGQQSSSS